MMKTLMYDMVKPMATVYFKNGDVVSARLVGYIFDDNEDVAGYELEGIKVETHVIDLITIDYANTKGESK